MCMLDFYSRDKAYAAREPRNFILHRCVDNEDDIAWNQFLWGTSDEQGSLNNVIREDVTRYMKQNSRHRKWTLLTFGRGTKNCIQSLVNLSEFTFAHLLLL